MIIRKQFKFEGAHVVRDCSSDRCKKSLHGHSYVVEVFLSSDGLDNGQMVMDFGLLKTHIAEFVDSFDHAYSMWNRETLEFKDFIKKTSARWIEMPVSPSAEMYSLMFYFVISRILSNTVFNNGEKNVRLHSVRVHETATGWAESFQSDLQNWQWTLQDIKFSPEIEAEWKNKKWWDDLKNHIYFVNPVIDLKYQK